MQPKFNQTILHLANVAGKRRGGGVHSVCFTLFDYQVKVGINVSLWFPGIDEELKEIQNEIPKKDGWRVKKLSTFFSPNWGVLKHFFKTYKQLDQFDLIHQHGVWLPISIVNSVFKRKNSISILQPHGYIQPHSLQMSRGRKWLMYQMFEKYNIQNSTILLACSEREKDFLHSYFPEKDVAVIANGIDPSFMNAPRQVTPTNEKMTYVFMSRLHPSKGIEKSLEALVNIYETNDDSWEYIIAGAGSSMYEASLKDYVNQLGLSQNVTFVGAKYGKDKRDLLDKANLFLLPTKTENFGIVIIEALSRGIPVLTTTGAPWKELIEYACGFWVEDSVVAIQKGIDQFLSFSNKEKIAFGENGKKLVQSKYLWPEINKKTLELYRWLFNKSLASPDFVFPGNKNRHGKKLFYE